MALGPIGAEYTNGTLAAIHEQLQTIAWVIGAQYGDESPVEQPRHFPRPHEMFIPRSESEKPKELTLENFDGIEGGADELNAFFDDLEAKQ